MCVDVVYALVSFREMEMGRNNLLGKITEMRIASVDKRRYEEVLLYPKY
jgi:hypothetical protein